MNTAELIPLKPEVFEILLRLTEGECHGYAMMGDIAERTDGAVTMLPGALYRHLKRLLDDGLIEELDRRDAPSGNDERRRYYGITPLGRAVAQAEAARLARQVEAARAHDLLDSGR
ncbi:MAG: PadR family transcriptional regulator [Acidobacteriota bacterium]|jgi:DNA-binding PadR family transcriptional regulator